MLKRIFFVRHGETDFNKSNIIQGTGIDAPLNEKGKNQALTFYKYYKHLSFDRVYTSALRRTYQSMEHFIQNGVPHEVLEGFNEMHFGEYEGKPMFDEKGNFSLSWILNKWRENDGNAKAKNGESPFEVMEREKIALSAVIANQNEKNVIVCMHGRALKVLLCYLLRKPISSMENYNHNNLETSIFDFDYKQNRFIPVEIISSKHFL